jgi:hypothetical protein
MTVSVNNVQRQRRIAYIALGIIFLLLAGGALLAYKTAETNAEAEQKADQFVNELAAHNLRTPTREQVIGVLGDDGGALCHDPASGLSRGILYGQLTNGAGGPGARPVIVDNKVVQGQLIAIKVYCPEKLDDFTEVVNDLKYANVVKE